MQLENRVDFAIQPISLTRFLWPALIAYVYRIERWGRFHLDVD